MDGMFSRRKDPVYYSVDCKSEQGKGYREKQTLARFRLILSKDVRQRLSVSNLFSEKADYRSVPDSLSDPKEVAATVAAIVHRKGSASLPV